MSNQANSNRRIAPGVTTLWAAAFVIFAMILMQASRLGPGVAYANDSGSVADLALATVAVGNNEDVMVVLDGRAEKVMVYGISGNRQLEFLGNHSVSDLYIQGRQSVGRRSR